LIYWFLEEPTTGIALETELGRSGASGRAMVDPCLSNPFRFDWAGDIP
jgi:hypothetical protein